MIDTRPGGYEGRKEMNMQPLIRMETKSGNVIWIRTEKISAFCYREEMKVTEIWTDGDEPFSFPGNHTDEIISAIHGWDN